MATTLPSSLIETATQYIIRTGISFSNVAGKIYEHMVLVRDLDSSTDSCQIYRHRNSCVDGLRHIIWVVRIHQHRSLERSRTARKIAADGWHMEWHNVKTWHVGNSREKVEGQPVSDDVK